MKTVFISSTRRDLADYRAAAIDICLCLGYTPIAMEYFSAMLVGARAGSLKKLDEADLYVGFFGTRGISVAGGVTDSDPDEVAMKAAMVRHCLQAGVVVERVGG